MKKLMTVLLSVFLLLSFMPSIMAQETLKDYPTDIKIEETENGDIKITSQDQEYLKAVAYKNSFEDILYYVQLTNKADSGYTSIFQNYGDKFFDRIEYNQSENAVVIKNGYFSTTLQNGEYYVDIFAKGYQNYRLESFNITKTFDLLKDVSNVEVSQNDTDVIIRATGNDAAEFIKRLYEGNVEHDYGVEGFDKHYGSINVYLKKGDHEYSASIVNLKRIGNDGERIDLPIYKVDNNAAYISKKKLAESGFMNGLYTFVIDVLGCYGNKPSAIELDLGKPFTIELCSSVSINNKFDAFVGQTTDLNNFNFDAKAIINGQEVDANDKVNAIVVDKNTGYKTEDNTFIEGKEYILRFKIKTLGYDGIDQNTTLTYNGNKYNAENESSLGLGGTNGTWMDVNTVKIVDIPLTVSEKPVESNKVNIPTANKDLVYTGKELVGVNEAEGYTLTNNKATNAGEYVAKATLKEGYKWSDNTTEVKEIKWSISKATPTYTLPTDLKGLVGEKLLTIKLPSGWTWKDGTKLVSATDNIAIYTPTDTKNYLTVEVKLNIELSHKVEIEEGLSLELSSKVETENNESSSDNTGNAFVTNDGVVESIKDVMTNDKSKTVIEGDANKLINEAIKATKEDKVVKVDVVTTLVKEEKKATDIAKDELKEIEVLTKDLTVQSYLDLSMKLDVKTSIDDKTFESKDSSLRELNKPVELVLKLDLPKDFNVEDYKFYVIAVHKNADGSLDATKKEAKLNIKDSTIAFVTDKFSTYAIAYEKVTPTKPTTTSKPSTPSVKPNYIIPNTSTR